MVKKTQSTRVQESRFDQSLADLCRVMTLIDRVTYDMAEKAHSDVAAELVLVAGDIERIRMRILSLKSGVH